MKKHQELVASLCKDGELIKRELTPQQAHLWHMVTGLIGEAGEVLDTIKKHCIYQKELDIENIIEELGDIEFFMEGIRYSLNLNRKQILKQNITKLRKRYGEKYSNKAAIDRVDELYN